MRLITCGDKMWKLQFTRGHKNLTIDWKNVVLSEETQFLSQRLDGRVRFDMNNIKAWLHPAMMHLSVAHIGGNGVTMVWGNFLCTLWVP